MKFTVHMLAFSEERGKTREVDVPTGDAESAPTKEDLLDLIFKYGQNEKLRLPIYSVSTGDVIEINHYPDNPSTASFFMVMGVGFKEISREVFENLQPPTSWMAFTGGLKEFEQKVKDAASTKDLDEAMEKEE